MSSTKSWPLELNVNRMTYTGFFPVYKLHYDITNALIKSFVTFNWKISVLLETQMKSKKLAKCASHTHT